MNCETCGTKLVLEGPEPHFSEYKCPNKCNEEETNEAFEAVSRLREAATKAMHLLRFARPTDKRKEVLEELEESIREARDSLFQ